MPRQPTLADRAYWCAVKATHDTEPPDRFISLIHNRNHARGPFMQSKAQQEEYTRVLAQGEARYGPHTRGDRSRMDYRPARIVVDRFAELYRDGRRQEATALITNGG